MKEVGAEGFVPLRADLPELRAAARGCEGCELYRAATQTVFGEGRVRAALMLVGEQPGDAEDRAGRPFVGPSGKLLDACLVEAGIDRGNVYVTNAVKHFRFEERGKRRIHKKPTTGQVRACHPWLEAERTVVKPRVVVSLGATAAQALALVEGWPPIVGTLHPSAVLRAPTHEDRSRMRKELVGALKRAAKLSGS